MDYPIHDWMPASSKSRQISPVNSNIASILIIDLPVGSRIERRGFDGISWLGLWSNVKLNNFNLHTYNDKSEMDYPIYDWMPASSKSRQISPVNPNIASILIIDLPVDSRIERRGFDGISWLGLWSNVKLNNFNLHT